MKPTTDSAFGIPATAQILRYLIGVLGLPIKGARGFSYKDLQRLERGGISRRKIQQVISAVIDHIWSLGAGNDAGGRFAEVRSKFEDNLPAATTWTYDEQDRAIFGRAEFLRDFLEFLDRSDQLRRELGPAFRGRGATFIWLRQFVIPFWAANLAEYYYMGVEWDRGMPGGKFWFLPQIRLGPEGVSVHKWPANLVLAWWRDLLGHPLERFADTLCGKEATPDNARRQIYRWLNEDNPPGFETIERWLRHRWSYEGTFEDDASASLPERWKRCREFLGLKAMIADASWKEKSPILPGEQVVRNQARGEPLELEIPAFQAHSFSAFFESADPVAAGLPVGELMARVAARWRGPSVAELRLRFHIACAVQRAWQDAADALGETNAWLLSNWFQSAYNHLLQAHRDAVAPTAQGLTASLENVISDDRLAFGALIWIYSSEGWSLLPRLMMRQLQIQAG
jgi:hypothetical protein